MSFSSKRRDDSLTAWRSTRMASMLSSVKLLPVGRVTFAIIERSSFLVMSRLFIQDDFLEFSKAMGNDLSTPAPQFNFAGLKPGDQWCVCAGRWVEAYRAGKAAPIVLEATHQSLLDYLSFDELKKLAVE